MFEELLNDSGLVSLELESLCKSLCLMAFMTQIRMSNYGELSLTNTTDQTKPPHQI